jgi:large subunit ribosomal protein L5
MAARLREKYYADIVSSLTKAFGYTNVMRVPKLQKIIVHVTMGEATQNIKLLDAAVKELAAITGQKPQVTKSKKAIAGFKLKENVPLGCKVTLRGERMFEFLDRLISVALPRIRDFRGLSTKAFDGRGNYAFGLKEQYIFPEIDYDKVETVHGLDINICTTAKTDEESRALLKEFGMPFRR